MIGLIDHSLPDKGFSAKPYYPEDPLATLIRNPAIISTFLSKKAPLVWDEQIKIHQVLDYFFNFFLEGRSLSYVPKTVTRIRQHTSSEQISLKRNLFEPYGKGKVLAAYKERLNSSGQLTFCQHEALDKGLLANSYQLIRSGRKMEAFELSSQISWDRITQYDWYKPWGFSGFSKILGLNRGPLIFYYLQRFLGRA